MKCTNCEGRGFYMYREGKPESLFLNPRFPCHVCNATGELTTEAALLRAGYTLDSIIAAVNTGDMTLLKHTGLA